MGYVHSRARTLPKELRPIYFTSRSYSIANALPTYALIDFPRVFLISTGKSPFTLFPVQLAILTVRLHVTMYVALEPWPP